MVSMTLLEEMSLGIHETLKGEKKKKKERENKETNDEEIPPLRGTQKASFKLLKVHRSIKQSSTMQVALTLSLAQSSYQCTDSKYACVGASTHHPAFLFGFPVS